MVYLLLRWYFSTLGEGACWLAAKLIGVAAACAHQDARHGYVERRRMERDE